MDRTQLDAPAVLQVWTRFRDAPRFREVPRADEEEAADMLAGRRGHFAAEPSRWGIGQLLGTHQLPRRPQPARPRRVLGDDCGDGLGGRRWTGRAGVVQEE